MHGFLENYFRLLETSGSKEDFKAELSFALTQIPFRIYLIILISGVCFSFGSIGRFRKSFKDLTREEFLFLDKEFSRIPGLSQISGLTRTFFLLVQTAAISSRVRDT